MPKARVGRTIADSSWQLIRSRSPTKRHVGSVFAESGSSHHGDVTVK
jgi:hypothetical protein